MKKHCKLGVSCRSTMMQYWSSWLVNWTEDRGGRTGVKRFPFWSWVTVRAKPNSALLPDRIEPAYSVCLTFRAHSANTLIDRIYTTNEKQASLVRIVTYFNFSRKPADRYKRSDKSLPINSLCPPCFTWGLIVHVLSKRWKILETSRISSCNFSTLAHYRSPVA